MYIKDLKEDIQVTPGCCRYRVDEAKNQPPEPEDYVRVVRHHAKQRISQTLYPGGIYEGLDRFLSSSQIPDRSSAAEYGTCASHGVLYSFRTSAARPIVERFKQADVCSQTLKVREGEHSCASILFLRGHSSKEWLSAVGAAWTIDPEFLNSGMLFRCQRHWFAYPSPPSSYDNIIRFPVVTIGSRDTRPHKRPIDEVRAETSRCMEHYKHALMNGHGVHLSDSIVRDFHVLDAQYFIIEQEISVCVQFHDKDKKPLRGWTGKLQHRLFNISITTK